MTQTSSESQPADETADPFEPPQSIHTSNFSGLLRQLKVSLAVTTYQAGKIIFVHPNGQTLNNHLRSFDRPMGLATMGGRLAMGCKSEVLQFDNIPALAAKVDPEGRHDSCYVRRTANVTGEIDIHEMEFAEDGVLWFVNTRFSCLCTLDNYYSFSPRWRPPFILSFAPEDRCHLNGLALVNGRPKYMTALGSSNESVGWRKNKAAGGILMDVTTNSIVLDGLSMPHSPRWRNNELWLLESGDGSIGRVDLQNRKYNKLCEFPGFTRGMDFAGEIAFVGLSQVRESANFSGIPITARTTAAERVCGIYAVNLVTGKVVAYLQFTAGVKEIFAVRVLPNMQRPNLVADEVELVRKTYILPPSPPRPAPPGPPSNRIS